MIIMHSPIPLFFFLVQANGRFAVTVDPDNADLKKRIDEVEQIREKGEPTVRAKERLTLYESIA